MSCSRCKGVVEHGFKNCVTCGLKLKKDVLDSGSSSLETYVSQKLEKYAQYFDPPKEKKRKPKRRSSRADRIATVPNPQEKLPPLGTTAQLDAKVQVP